MVKNVIYVTLFMQEVQLKILYRNKTQTVTGKREKHIKYSVFSERKCPLRYVNYRSLIMRMRKDKIFWKIMKLDHVK